MKLLIGLGNPGSRYAKTRHNAGFISVDALAKSENATWKKKADWHAETCEILVGKERVILIKPQTFMNRSGEAVTVAVSFYRADPKDVLIIHDDMDIEEGRMQFKNGGSPAGHNGVKDIQEKLGTKTIARLRIGVGHPEGEIAPEDWVLSKLSPKSLPDPLDIIAGMRDWIEYGLEKASNTWNVKKA